MLDSLYVQEEKDLLKKILVYLSQHKDLYYKFVKEHEVQRNHTISTNNEHFYVIKSGVFVTEVALPNEKKYPHFLLTDYQVLGPHPVNSDHSITHRALVPSTYYSIDQEFMYAHFYAQPHFFKELLDIIVKKQSILTQKLSLLHIKPVAKVSYILCLLISMLSLEKDRNSFELPPYLTQSLVSNFSRVNKYTVTQVYQQLTEEGLITSKGRKVLINDFKRLKAEVFNDFPLYSPRLMTI
ncbi:cAMP-binding domain-containing protein [Listeria floridensis FSL S10-1187]|uniref:cAMP-binding domain-containing protein n=1 Tax=Listeria floridensis FSL S10-1187 TaxID=1265817 RepID=A0ABN0REU9_9LIST|nr:Crp/Fnr family transcriptional regulator [Listeria floridensis]EUJ31676.1 cAMP-binding domain-containing protein [Listeria floridensis FSL S10-1187]